MEVETCHWGGVGAVGDMGVDACWGTGTVVAVHELDRALFRASEEVGSLCRGKSGARWGDVVGKWSAGKGCGCCGDRRAESEAVLWGGEHVNGPGADDAIGRCRDDVVGVLGADNVEGVDRVGVTGAGKGGLLDV